MSAANLMKILEKKYEKDAVEIFVDLTKRVDCDVIPFRSVILNAITGVGGVPRGRLTEIFGTESSGKTTLATELCADLITTNPDAVAVYLDYEHVFDPTYAAHLGLQLGNNNFVFAQPQTFEQGFDIIDTFLDAGAADLYIIDSGSAMIPKDELEAKIEDKTRIGFRARKMSQMLPRLTKKLSKGRQPALVLINQMRNTINANPYLSGLNSMATQAEKFYASMRIQLAIERKEGEQKGTKKDPMSQMYSQNRVRATTIKNKVACPFMRGTFVIEYGEGVSNLGSIAEMAAKDLEIMKGGGNITWNGKTPETTLSVRGIDKFIEALRTNAPLYEEVTAAVMENIEKNLAKDLGVSSITTKEQDEFTTDLEADLDDL